MPKAAAKAARFSLARWLLRRDLPDLEYRTDLGAALVGRSEELLLSPAGQALNGNVQLVLTSPPYPLNRKKAYGNQTGAAFKLWLQDYARILREVLAPDGSIVVEMGNAWEPGLPVMSTLAIESLIAFKEAANLYLCQEFIWHNNAKLPTPAQWVTVDRVRAKDSFTRLWWMSPTPHPKADNRRVLTPYSNAMKRLLKRQSYNSGLRPSEHAISKRGFLTDHGGAIPASVLFDSAPESLIVGANTDNTDSYHSYCRTHGLTPHPARMPMRLATFFIQLCTEPHDLVFDPFGGSNTTGAAAEAAQRRWITVEAKKEYAEAGIGRFPDIAR